MLVGITVQRISDRAYLACRCWLDGVDVGCDAFAADDEEGWVEMMLRDDEGHVRIARDDAGDHYYPVRSVRHGHVELELVEDR